MNAREQAGQWEPMFSALPDECAVVEAPLVPIMDAECRIVCYATPENAEAIAYLLNRADVGMSSDEPDATPAPPWCQSCQSYHAADPETRARLKCFAMEAP